MKKKLLFLIALISFVFGFAQKENNIWYFGYGVGVDFNSGEPVVTNNGKLFSSEGSSSVCTKNGRLLFYTDGVDVWDSLHELMPNGFGLLGNRSTTQSALIIPKPGSKKVFYIFTADEGHVNKGLNYSELDMDLNLGYGDIVKDKKNIGLTTNTNEKIAATYHSNGKDIWVLIHKYNTDSIYAYLVTGSGVQANPIKSATGFWAPYSLAGQMKISPNGKRIAIAHYAKVSIVGNFNIGTGKVSNTWSLPYPWYGLEFSPSGNFLYSYGPYSTILQFDLRANSPKTILESEEKVGKYTSNSCWAFQLGPDGKIYIANPGKFLHVIHSPESKGTDCRFENNSLYLNDEFCGLGLPTFISSSFNWLHFEIKGSCLNDSIRFTISDLKNSDSLLWDFGDPASGVANFSRKSANVFC